MNTNIRRWHDNIARGSPITAEVKIRRLSRFCEIIGKSPMEIAELGMNDLRTMTNILEDSVTWLEEQNYSPGYIEDILKAVKSWLRSFDVEIKRKIKVKNPDYTPTLQNERVPNAEEMSEIDCKSNLRTSVMISLMAKSGLRPEVIGNHDGTEGLRIKDLPDIVIHQGTVKCIDTPNRIIVRRELSKTRHQYFTFSTSLATKKIIAYLNDRLECGESLNGDSPVVAPDYIYKTNRGKNNNKPFLPTRQISREIRNTLRPKFKWRPYNLRCYFDTQLLISESRGKIAGDFRSFFMGHKATIEQRYTTNKGILPEIMMKEMRDAFSRSEELLDLELQKENPVLKQKEALKDTIQNATPEELGQVLEVFQRLNIGKTNQFKK
ncbi:site-specific integrase [Nitrosarchaeum sp. AC2]|uniref:site-specific integrase n=1 Tax=Nitrosarchaeum sp. AC2 TaxID=2259673 RepID=UPI0015CE7B49|nr:site-specific integrase [Nitrosarchaeum sp. AC2]